MKEIINWALHQPFFENPLSEDYRNELKIEAPLKVDFQPKNSKIYLITGENATGKSYFIKTMKRMLSQKRMPLYHMGITSRMSDSFGEGSEHFWAIAPEQIASTGENTTTLLLNGPEGAKSLKEKSYLLLDEPTIGLSLGYQEAIAKYLKGYSLNLPKKIGGIMICSHNHKLLSELETINPNHIRFGDKKTLNQVINEPHKNTLENLKNLPIIANETRAKIEKIEDILRKK